MSEIKTAKSLLVSFLKTPAKFQGFCDGVGVLQ